MYCFYTYRRTLQILKEKEEHLQKPFYSFDTLDKNDNCIKTKYTNIQKEAGIIYHIFIHTSSLLSKFILPSTCDDKVFEKNVEKKLLSDLFEICYMNGVYDNYEENEKQYEGDDFLDIFEKYHYTRFPNKLEEIPSFVESLNNMELIRVMSLISWHLRRDKPQLENFTSFKEKEFYDINRLIEMNEQIIGYMENKELTIEKKRLLNLCFGYYINHNMEDRVLSLIEHYPIDMFIFNEKHFTVIYQQSLYKILYELICNQYFCVYDLEDLIKQSKLTSTYRYSMIQRSIIERKVEKDYEKDVVFGLPEENEEEKEKKKNINIFIDNIEFLDLVEFKKNGENHEDVIQYLQHKPDIIIMIPIHYMYFFIKNPDILLYMFEHKKIHLRVELFIYIFKYSTTELFSKMKKYVSFNSLNFYCKFDWDIYDSIDDGSIPNEESFKKKTACFTEEKKEIRYKKVQSQIPDFLSIQMKSMIMTYLCK